MNGKVIRILSTCSFALLLPLTLHGAESAPIPGENDRIDLLDLPHLAPIHCGFALDIADPRLTGFQYTQRG